MTPIAVTAVDDPRLDAFRRIKGQSDRGDGTFVAESELVLERLFASGFVVRSILITPARAERLNEFFAASVGVGGTRDTQVFVAAQAVIDEVVGYALHRGVIAVAERPVEPTLDDVLRDARTIVVLEEVMDPDNVGSVFRHAAGFGVDAVLLSGKTGDPLYRKAIRTSMGWSLQIPYARVEGAAALWTALHEYDFVTLALTPDRSAETLASIVETLPSTQRIAVMLGAEGPGLRAESLANADRRVRIPLADTVDSLNVATAAAIALYALGQRR